MSAEFSIVAIIAAYNEADVIEQVVGDLVHQGVQVYFLDDDSTDGTAALVERHLGRGVLAVERLADTVKDARPGCFEWERILLRKAQIAAELDASWFIHHDADEFRESPWSHLSLNRAIQHVDALGFNAIDFAGLDFWPVHDGFRAGDDIRATFTRYSEPETFDRVQIRCWKKVKDVDLVSSGGHEARFRERRVFPLRFIMRHYPIRGQKHGERKVFLERRSRFDERERARGWHVQYDRMQEGISFIRDPATLTPYDPDAFRIALALRHRGVESLEDSLTRARADLAARTAETAAIRGHVAKRDAELAEAQGQLHARGAETAKLREALRGRDTQIENLQHAVADRTRQLAEFHDSLSWRWTSPARAAYRFFKGLAPGR